MGKHVCEHITYSAQVIIQDDGSGSVGRVRSNQRRYMQHVLLGEVIGGFISEDVVQVLVGVLGHVFKQGSVRVALFAVTVRGRGCATKGLLGQHVSIRVRHDGVGVHTGLGAPPHHLLAQTVGRFFVFPVNQLRRCGGPQQLESIGITRGNHTRTQRLLDVLKAHQHGFVRLSRADGVASAIGEVHETDVCAQVREVEGQQPFARGHVAHILVTVAVLHRNRASQRIPIPSAQTYTIHKTAYVNKQTQTNNTYSSKMTEAGEYAPIQSPVVVASEVENEMVTTSSLLITSGDTSSMA
jgi:hypothetical protein